RLAALLGADAADDQARDAVAHEPDVEAAADQGAVAALVEDDIRRDRQAGHRLHVAGRERESAVVLDVEDLHDRNAARPGAVDQRLQVREKRRRVAVVPVRPVAERFLGVDDDQGAVGKRHDWWSFVAVADLPRWPQYYARSGRGNSMVDADNR